MVIPSAKEQAEKVGELLSPAGLASEMKEGSIWYPLSVKWLRSFRQFIGLEEKSSSGEPEPPGPIDNTDLQDDEVPECLKQGLVEYQHFEWVPKNAWELLYSWYGGGPAFPREVQALGSAKDLRVDMYPQHCTVFVVDDRGDCNLEEDEPVSMLLRRNLNIIDARAEILRAINFDPDTDTPQFLIRNRGTWKGLEEEDINYDNVDVEEQVANNQKDLGILVADSSDRTLVDKAAESAERAMRRRQDTPSWRLSLAKNNKVDAQDKSGEWRAGTIVQIYPPTSGDSADDDRIEVQFEGFSGSHEHYLRSSKKILPLYSKTKNWRAKLSRGSFVEYCQVPEEGRWKLCKVVSRDDFSDPASLSVKPLDTPWDTTRVRIDSDKLCAGGTHVELPQNSKLDEDTDDRTSLSVRSKQFGSSGKQVVRGTVGLNNIGNTCFMNSMLQCLSNTEPLTRYFLSGEWKKDVNPDNPLGEGGRIATAYAKLLKEIWSGATRSFSPRELKQEVGRAKSDFLGYAQQDSQEFMSFLLDGIHEDLNRIRKKPYIEDVESKGRPDAIVAREAWRRAKMRNDSIVWDIFAGQLKSHICCNVCSYESITFDPYTTLSLTISEHETKKALVFTFIPYEGQFHHTRYKSLVPKGGVINDIIEWLCYEAKFPHPEDADKPREHAKDQSLRRGENGLAPAEMIVTKVSERNGRIEQVLHPQDPIADIHGNDWIYVYEIPKPDDPRLKEVEEEKRKKHHRAEMARAFRQSDREIEKLEGETDEDIEELLKFKYIENEEYLLEVRHRVEGSSFLSRSFSPYGLPEALSVPYVAGNLDAGVTGRQLYQAVWQKVQRWMVPDCIEEFSAENPPYSLSLGKLDEFGTARNLEKVKLDDESIQTDPPSVLCVDWKSIKHEHGSVKEGHAIQDNHKVVLQEESSYEPVKDKDDVTDLETCLKRNSEKEQLGSHDMWFCSNCRCFRQAYKKMDIYTAPDILVVHLKRFHSTNYGRSLTSFLQRDKLNNLVKFPTEGLDLTPYVVGPQKTKHIYDCYGVSNHSGGLGGGHYTAYAKNFENGTWYHFNDSFVGEANDDDVVTRQAYVLFFRRREPSGIPEGDFLEEAAQEAAQRLRQRGDTVGSLGEEIPESKE